MVSSFAFLQLYIHQLIPFFLSFFFQTMEKVMDFGYDGDDSCNEGSLNTGEEEEQFRRHYNKQIQQLEE